MSAKRRIAAPWSNLPKDLLGKIAKCFDTETDVLRFRAVCSPWRSSVAPFKRFPCETVKLPFPFDATEVQYPYHDGAYYGLVERTVYRVELPHNTERKPNFWLVKIERLSDGKLRILNPVSHRALKVPLESKMPKVMNTLDFRIYEVCKAYTLTYLNHSLSDKNYENVCAKKVAVCTGVENGEYVIMAIDNEDLLWSTKSGDEKWTKWTMASNNYRFCDVVKYKGQFHGIDVFGGVWAFGSNLASSNKTPYVYGSALKRRMVELCGKLFLVEEVKDKDERLPVNYALFDEWSGMARSIGKPYIDIIISELERGGKEWVETKAVNNWIIVVGDDCSYAVSTKGFKGCKGTRIFYPRWHISIDSDGEQDDYYNSSGCYCSDCSPCNGAVEEDYDGDDVYDYYSYECDCGYDTGHSDFLVSDEIKSRFKGFHSDNVGVCNYETGKTGPVLMFPEYADIFWPPPSWLVRT